MEDNLLTMLKHRGRSVVVQDTISITEDIVKYKMTDKSDIIVCMCQLRKSDLGSVNHDDTSTIPTIVTSKSISRPCLVSLSNLKMIEYIPSDLYVFDRLLPIGVPCYHLLNERTIRHLETLHKCSREKWPILKYEDPIARYLGLHKGSCVSYGIEHNVRYVS